MKAPFTLILDSGMRLIMVKRGTRLPMGTEILQLLHQVTELVLYRGKLRRGKDRSNIRGKLLLMMTPFMLIQDSEEQIILVVLRNTLPIICQRMCRGNPIRKMHLIVTIPTTPILL